MKTLSKKKIKKIDEQNKKEGNKYTVAILPRNETLISGQRVLFYKETDKDILSLAGKSIGKKECVVGTGRTKIDAKRISIDSPELGSVLIEREKPLPKFRTRALKNRHCSMKNKSEYQPLKIKLIDD